MNHLTQIANLPASQNGVAYISGGNGALARNPSRTIEQGLSLPQDNQERISASIVIEHIRTLRRRKDFFGDDLFADPAWELLLCLFASYLEQRRLSISKLTALAKVPPTTALRWITRLHDKGWLTKTEDPTDNRRVFVGLSFRGSVALNGYFGSCGYAPMVL